MRHAALGPPPDVVGSGGTRGLRRRQRGPAPDIDVDIAVGRRVPRVRRARDGRGPLRAIALRALIGVALAFSGGPVVADLRVLLAFDGDGHRVHRVQRVGPTMPDPSRPAPRWKRTPAADAEPRPGQAVLLWLDAAGGTLAVEHVPDPRLVHVPLGADRPPGSPPIARAALREGSWLARGPDRAATLVLSLPGRAEPPLASGEWTFDLGER